MKNKLNGYVVKIYTFELKGGSKDFGHVNYPEALHFARKFNHCHGIDKWEVYHPSGKLMTWNECGNKKGEINLMLDQYYQENPVGNGEFNEKATEAVKGALVLLKVPFVVRGEVREVPSASGVGKYNSFIAMDIHLVDSDATRLAQKTAHLSNDYSLTLSGSPRNIGLMKVLNEHFVDTDNALILAKDGNAYVLQEA